MSLLWVAALAWAGPRGEVRQLLEEGRAFEAAAQCRVALNRHPGKGWALRGLREALSVELERHLAAARSAAQAGDLGGVDAAMERALRQVEAAGAEGVDLSGDGVRAEGEALRGEVVRGWETGTADALARGDRDGARRLLGLLRGFSPGAAAGLWTELLRADVAAAEGGAARAQALQALAVHTGDAADRGAAAEAWAAHGAELRARGACRAASDALRAAVQLDATHQAALDEVDRCAATDLVVTVTGRPRGLVDALRGALVEGVQRQGSRFLRVVDRGRALSRTVPGEAGPDTSPDTVEPTFVQVEVVSVTAVEGDPSVRVTTRPMGASVGEVRSHELTVTVAVVVRVHLTVDGVARPPAQVSESDVQVARWEGRPVAIRGPDGKRRPVEGDPSGDRAPAVASATATATEGAVRAVAARVVAELVASVDREEPAP